MKPCPRNRERIAWLLVGTPDAIETAWLRAHLATCEGCRHYYEELSSVAQSLIAAEPQTDFEVGEAFFRAVDQKLRASESQPRLATLAPFFGRVTVRWPIALSAGALLGVMVLAWVASHRPSFPPSPIIAVQQAAVPQSDLAPSLANYRLLAGQSVEKLSEVLTRQGERKLPPAAVYTPSGIETADAPF